MPFSNLTAPSAALRVCVDRAEPGCFSGRVYSQRLTAPIPFSDVGALLLRLDEVLDSQNFPQAFQQARSFTPRGQEALAAAESPADGLPAETVAAARGSAATFDLYIIARRSSSWQGRVDWLDGAPPIEFPSALELTRLLEARLLRDF